MVSVFLGCLFSLFTLKTKRKRGYGEKILKYGIKQIKNKQAKLLISGIEPTNIESIKLHEKVGFRNSGKMWNELAYAAALRMVAAVYHRVLVVSKIRG